MKEIIINFPIIPFVLFLIATIKGCKKGRRVALKYFCGAILVLALIALWNICILMDVAGSQGMGTPELLAQHISILLWTCITGSFLANASYTTIFLSNFKREYVLADILILITFTTTLLCSYGIMKAFQIFGGSV